MLIAKFTKECQGCSVSVSLAFSEAALESLSEEKESSCTSEDPPSRLACLLEETVLLLDRAELAVLSNQVDSLRSRVDRDLKIT